MKKLAVFLFLALLGALSSIGLSPNMMSAVAADETNTKVWVCKYSATPETGEKAQVVISVDYQPGREPGTWGFEDAQGASYVYGFSVGPDAIDKPSAADDCPPFNGDVVCPEGTDNAGEVVPDGQTIETYCNDPDVVCPEGTDNAGEVVPDGQTIETYCNDPDVVCPEGTDNAGEVVPDGQTIETYCNDPDVVCPEGTDNAGEVVPDGQTIETYCNDPDVVCPEGTDNAGEVVPDGQTIEEFCDDPDDTEVAAKQAVAGCDIKRFGKAYGAGRLSWMTTTSGTPPTTIVSDVVFTPWSRSTQIDAGCIERGDPPNEPEVAGAQASAQPAASANVPTAVDAGLAAPAAAAPSVERSSAAAYGAYLAGSTGLLTLMVALALALRRRNA